MTKCLRWPTPSILVTLAAVLAVSAVTYGSFVPLNYAPKPWDETIDLARAIPWLTIGIDGRADWVANGALFFPCGLLLAAAISLGRGALVRSLSAAVVGITLTLLAVGIEIAQLWFPGRTVSINDIASETIGAWLGALTWACFAPDIRTRVRLLAISKGRTLQIALFEVYLATLLLYGLAPFDLILSKQDWEAKSALGRFGWGWTDLKAILMSVVMFLPIGLYANLRWKHLRRALVFTATFAAVYEILQAPVYSRTTAVSHVIAAAIGGSLGVGIASQRRWGAILQQRHVPLGATLTYLTLVTATFWYPFDLTPPETWGVRLNEAWKSPFSAHYYGSEFQTLTNMATRMALFGTGGAVLCVTASVNARFARVLLISWPIVTELAQVFFESKLADGTDAIVGVIAAFLGFFGGRFARGRLSDC